MKTRSQLVWVKHCQTWHCLKIPDIQSDQACLSGAGGCGDQGVGGLNPNRFSNQNCLFYDRARDRDFVEFIQKNSDGFLRLPAEAGKPENLYPCNARVANSNARLASSFAQGPNTQRQPRQCINKDIDVEEPAHHSRSHSARSCLCQLTLSIPGRLRAPRTDSTRSQSGGRGVSSMTVTRARPCSGIRAGSFGIMCPSVISASIVRYSIGLQFRRAHSQSKFESSTLFPAGFDPQTSHVASSLQL